MNENLGALAAALAKAQAAFPAITRDKEVKVTSTRTGNSYTFKYAPLDKIIDKTRGPLSDNGLAVAQLLDSDADGAPALVTMLLHADGGSLTARTPIAHPDGATAQEFGSAITYLRRYAYTAILGIATEDDDDGNAAAGNAATFTSKKAASALPVDGLIGTVHKQDSRSTDFELRQSPEGSFLGFRLKNGNETGFICEVRGPMADALKAIEADVIGKRVQVWGTWVDYTPPTVRYAYKAFRVTKIMTPDYTLPAEGGPGQPPEAEAAGSGVDEHPAPALDPEIAQLSF